MGIIKRVQIKTTIITKIRIKITKKNIKVGTTEIIQNVQTAKKWHSILMDIAKTVVMENHLMKMERAIVLNAQIVEVPL